MSDTEVGVPLEGNAQRDAIHIAVAPVVATEPLRPGEAIGFVEAGNTETVGSDASKLIGIVDPFLKAKVKPGERFWMFLYPRTITALRHQWTHPAFADQVPVERSKSASEEWLRDFLGRNGFITYDELIAGSGIYFSADDDGYYGYRNDGEYLTVLGRDANGEIPAQFWEHVEVVTGKKIPSNKRASHFSCSC